jgi:hypothetical protein
MTTINNTCLNALLADFAYVDGLTPESTRVGVASPRRVEVPA